MSFSTFILGSSVFNLGASVLYILASLSAVIPLMHHWWHDTKRFAMGMTWKEYKAHRKKEKRAKKKAKGRGR